MSKDKEEIARLRGMVSHAAESIVAIHALLEVSQYDPAMYVTGMGAAQEGCKQTLVELGFDVNDEQFRKVSDFIRKRAAEMNKRGHN